MTLRNRAFVLSLLAASSLLPACSSMSEGERRTVGAVGGAVVGGLAGRAVGPRKHKTASTIIGALIGGVGGYFLAGAFGENATPEQKADPKYQQASNEFAQAEQARAAGNNDAAMQHYTTASQLAPDQPEPYNNAGMLYLGQGDRANAEANFRKALQVDPEYEPAKANLRTMGLNP